MKPAFSISFFVIALTTLLFLGASFLAQLTFKHFPSTKKYRAAIWLMVFLFLAVQLTAPALYRTWPSPPISVFAAQWFAYSTLGLFACFFIYHFFPVLIFKTWNRLQKRFFTKKPPVSMQIERRSFFTLSAFSFLSTSVGTYQAISGPGLKRVAIPIADLPAQLSDLKIVQISDLHIGPTIRESYIDRVIDLANTETPDLVVITGDLLDGTTEQIGDLVLRLNRLRARYGIYYITGNHEYYWGVDEWLGFLKANTPFKILLNEHAVIDINGQNLIIGGITDSSAARIKKEHEPNVTQAFEGCPKEGFKILLAHQPRHYDVANSLGVSLQLSGHTHAGQFFPWNLFVSIPFRYYRGLNRHENLWLYVSPGTGYWGPPMRFLIPAEVTSLRLAKATQPQKEL